MRELQHSHLSWFLVVSFSTLVSLEFESACLVANVYINNTHFDGPCNLLILVHFSYIPKHLCYLS